MHDPFPLPPPPTLIRLTRPLATLLSAPTLPLHIHELLLAAFFYHLTYTYLSPLLSARLFPRTYLSLNARTKTNWDVHVVSLVQSTFINAAALWVMWADEERAGMLGVEERVWGYTGACGMIQAFAAGYFLWDLGICVKHLGVFGWGLLMHAICALVVFGFGFVSSCPLTILPFSFPHCVMLEADGVWGFLSDPLSISTRRLSSSMSFHRPF